MERSRALVALEIATAFVVAALFVLTCTTINVNVLERLGQVSGIAAVEWRLLLFALPLLAVLALLTRGSRADLAIRFGSAALAGLSSAAVAGGIAVILHRTQFGLGATRGDAGTLINWAERLLTGQPVESPVYPPLQNYVLAGLSKLTGLRPAYAMPWFQIVGVAALGPCAYAAWRLLFRPRAAVVFAIVSSLPMIEAYREYPLLVLVVLVPVLIKFLRVLRYGAGETLGETLRSGVIFGISIAVLFLMYSGWFQWSAPGFLLAAAIVFPWRTGWKQGAVFCGAAFIVFVLLVHRYVGGVVHASGIADNYVYFDATVEPAFVAMWRGGLPGTTGVWPPVGELGGVGLFTVILAVGLAVAIALGRNRTLVVTIGCIMAGTWLFRMWHAQRMWKTKLVQLWPRTTAELLYLLVILVCFAGYLALERARDKAKPDSALRSQTAFFGLATGLVLLIGSSASPTVDRYMPRENLVDPGYLAWEAYHRPLLEVNQLAGATDTARSSVETDLWSVGGAIDHKIWRGYSSELGHREDHEEWLDVMIPDPRKFSRLVIWPAADGGPLQLVIEVDDGTGLVPVMTVNDLPQGHMFPQTIKLPTTYEVAHLRIRATKLRQVDDDYVFRVAEVELYE